MQDIVFYKSIENQTSIVCGHGISKSFPMHRHASYSIGAILKGKRQLTILNQNHEIKEGQIFVINSEEPHAIKEVTEATHDYIVISLTPAYIIRMLETDQPVFQNIFTNPSLLKIFQSLFSLAFKNSSLQTKDIDTERIVQIMGLYLNHNYILPIKDERLEKLRKNLDQSIELNLSIEDMADKACLSPFHFARQFKKYTGFAPHRYLLDNRLRYARWLLDTDMTITDISIKSGFYDTSHFINHFTKYFGVSPQTYRNGIRPIH